MMKRTNIFIVEDDSRLLNLADNCSRLWNELNYMRRQAYIHYKSFSCIQSIYIEGIICLFCGSEGVRRYRGLFQCLRCNIVLNADVVGVLNVARRYGAIIPSPIWDRDNGLVAQPLLLRWDGYRWKSKRTMNTQGMRILEARITLTLVR